MRIAVPYENGNVYGHFGHTEAFKLYDIVNGAVVYSQVVPTSGKGHGALAGFLGNHQVTCLICGGIGPGAKTALDEWGIRLYAGCSGSADQRVAELLAGTLVSVETVACGDHGEGHSCGHGHC